MSEMIDRVALAFAGLHITTAAGTRVTHQDVARAAIAAMRTPSEAMEVAGVRAHTDDLDVMIETVWQAMIDAALRD